MMIREAMTFVLLVLLLWSLHGMDLLYRVSFASPMFDINLMVSLMSAVGIGVLTFVDFKALKGGGKN